MRQRRRRELGTGSQAPATRPARVVGLPANVKVTALTSSWEGSGALLANGDYYGWGYNPAGQLGGQNGQLGVGSGLAVSGVQTLPVSVGIRLTLVSSTASNVAGLAGRS